METALSRVEALAGRRPAQAQLELRSLRLDEASLDARTRLRIDLIRLRIADAQYRPGDVLALADRIEAEAASTGDARTRAVISHARVNAEYQLGRSEDAWIALQQELQQAQASRQGDTLALALIDRAHLLMRRADFEQACVAITDAERLAQGGQARAEVAFANALLAKAIGDAPLALRSYQEAYDKFHTLGDRTGEADTQAGIGWALRRSGHSSDALQPLEQAIAAYQEVGDREGEAIAKEELALARADVGKPQQALLLNAEALQALGQVQSPLKQAQFEVDRARLLLVLNRAAEALPLIERARPVVLEDEDLQLQVQFHQVAAAASAALERYRSAFDEAELERRAQQRRTDQLVARQLAAQRGRLESERLTRENSLLRSEAEASEHALEQARRATRLQRAVIGLAALLILVGLVALWRQRALLKRIERMAETDPLTGVANRRQVIELGERLMMRCRQDGRPYAMLLLDLDGFKQINDRHGHAAGDRALCAVSQALRRSLRPGDHLGRYGGEEFAVILPDADAREAATVGERLRASVASLEPDWAPGAGGVTLSGGIAFATPGRTDFSQLMVRADQALYRAKNGGRNRIEVAAG